MIYYILIVYAVISASALSIITFLINLLIIRKGMFSRLSAVELIIVHRIPFVQRVTMKIEFSLKTVRCKWQDVLKERKR